MAIVQISQIKHRHGVQTDLPQLATAELGWSVDTRKLYIGNGTLSEGAPEVGNTEILTEHSNIPNYTVYTQGISPGTTANLNYGIVDYNKPAVYIQYAVIRDNDARTGWFKLAWNRGNVAAPGAISYDEEYTETANIGMTFGVIPVGTTGSGAYVQITATTTSSPSFSSNIQYTVSTLSF